MTEEVVHVKAEQDWGDYCSLSNSISYREVLGIFSLPSYICHLVPVNVDHQSDNYWRNMRIQKLLEELAVFYCVKGFGTIQKAPIYCTSFSQILINHLINYPGTKVGITELLETKLEFIALQKMTINQEDDPV